MNHADLMTVLSVLEEILPPPQKDMPVRVKHHSLHYVQHGIDTFPAYDWTPKLALTVFFARHQETFFLDPEDIDDADPLELVDSVLKLVHANERARKQLKPEDDAFANDVNAKMYRGRSKRFDTWLDLQAIQQQVARRSLIIVIQRLYRADPEDEVTCTTGTGARVGGHLHIVLDDLNVGDSSIGFCIEEAKNSPDGICFTCCGIGHSLLRIPEGLREALIKEARGIE